MQGPVYNIERAIAEGGLEHSRPLSDFVHFADTMVLRSFATDALVMYESRSFIRWFDDYCRNNPMEGFFCLHMKPIVDLQRLILHHCSNGTFEDVVSPNYRDGALEEFLYDLKERGPFGVSERVRVHAAAYCHFPELASFGYLHECMSLVDASNVLAQYRWPVGSWMIYKAPPSPPEVPMMINAQMYMFAWKEGCACTTMGGPRISQLRILFVEGVGFYLDFNFHNMTSFKEVAFNPMTRSTNAPICASMADLFVYLFVMLQNRAHPKLAVASFDLESDSSLHSLSSSSSSSEESDGDDEYSSSS